MSDGEPRITTETFALEHAWLGLEPYTLIRLQPASDGSGDPALFVGFGGGAENATYMPLLVITDSPPEGNPVAEMFRGLADEDRFSHPIARTTLDAVVREFNPDWISFVFRHSPD